MAHPTVQPPQADGHPGVGVPFPPDLHDARHLWLKAGLLAVWALVSFVATYFARDLQRPVGPWPLGYWIAAQGAVLVFIALVCIYCWAMNRFEREDAQRAKATATAAATAASQVAETVPSALAAMPARAHHTPDASAPNPLGATPPASRNA